MSKNDKDDIKNILDKLFKLDPDLDKEKLEQILLDEATNIKINKRPENKYMEKVLDEFTYKGKSYWRCKDGYLWDDDCNKVGSIKGGKIYLYGEKTKRFPKDIKEAWKEFDKKD